MAEKTRVKGDISKKFTITFDGEKDDQFFIVFKEKRLPKDRVKKGLPPVTIDFIQSSEKSCKEQAEMLCGLYEGGDSSIKAILGMFIGMTLSKALQKRAEDQKEYEAQKYKDEHNGNINLKDNNLSTKD